MAVAAPGRGFRHRISAASFIAALMLTGCEPWLASRDAAAFKLGEAVSLKLSMTKAAGDPPRFARAAWLERPGGSLAPQRLSVDTAEHATTSLYRCDRGTLMLVSDHDRWSVDTRSGAITSGACAEPTPLYLGAYDWDNGHVWRFFHARDHADRFAAKDPLYEE